MKSSPVFTHTTLLWLIAQSLSSTMMTLPPIVVHLGPVQPFPYEQHKIITAFVSPSRTWKQQHSALRCINLFKCVFLSIFWAIRCVFISFSWFKLSKLVWFGLYMNKSHILQNRSDYVPQSSLVVFIHPSFSPFCPNLSLFSPFLVHPTPLILCPFICLKPFFSVSLSLPAFRRGG